MGTIHITNASGERSEYSEEDFRGMLERREIPAGSYYWKIGMADWRPVSEMQEVASVVPGTESARVPDAAGTGYRYRKDPRQLTAFLIVMLWICFSFEVIAILSDLAQLALLSRDYTEAEAEVNDIRQGLIAFGYMVAYVVTAVPFLMWIYRANLNAIGFGGTDMKFTPGWSVGYYFIPILNLFRPYQSMKEIWQVSHDPANWKSVSVPPLVGWWWALWLVSNFLGYFTMQFSFKAETLDDIKALTGLFIFSEMVGAVLCLVAIAMVKSIARKQEDLVAGKANDLVGSRSSNYSF